MKKIIFLLLQSSIITLSALSSLKAEVYLSAQEAIKKTFGNFEEYKVEDYILDDQKLKVYTIFAANKVIGWAVELDEMGKNKPMTFLVGIDLEGKVLGVYLLEFRDLFGSEIRRRSFLRQFRGKSSKDLLMVGRDIDAVTSATISSHAASSSVRKSLKVIEELKGKE